MSKKAKGPKFLSEEQIHRVVAIAFLRGGEEAMKKSLSEIRADEERNLLLLAENLGIEYTSGDYRALLRALVQKHYPAHEKTEPPVEA